jgi:hypothetical protein
MSLYGQRTQRAYEKYKKELNELQEKRKAEKAAELEEARLLFQLADTQGLAYDPKKDGFVFSLQFIRAHSRASPQADSGEKNRKRLPQKEQSDRNHKGRRQSNGLPSLSNGYIVDGLETNDPLTNLNSGLSTNLVLGLNSIAEVTVNTLSYAVDQGRYGASQVNYVTKSGHQPVSRKPV